MDQVSDISANIKKQLAFTCTHESARIPPRDPEADQLYKRARWLIKGNILKNDPAVYPGVERLLRIATAYGHDRANIELRGMLDKGQTGSADPVNEAIDLVQDLIKRGIPAGYYDMAWYVEHGYGVKADQELAFKHYRKSADLGNPEGQYLVGRKLGDERQLGTEIATIGWSMWRCAADQHQAQAANAYANYLQLNHKYPEATKYFQIATMEGLSVAALNLAEAFSAKGNDDPIFALGQGVDAERQSRYKTIQDFFQRYDYLNAKVLEIDQIVPLPPAPLPIWNGKFQWLEQHKANIPPPLPSEVRIIEMARSKGLDPQTGRAVRAGK